MSVTNELSADVQGLWGVNEQTAVDIIRAVRFLSLQQSRTSSEDAVRLKDLVDSLSTLHPDTGERSLEYIDYYNVTDDEFSERFSSKLRPCMIRNCCKKDNWRALERWRSAEDLAKWYPHIPIRITEMKSHPGAKSEPVRIPLVNYISYCTKDSGGADFPWYGFDDNLRLSIESVGRSYIIALITLMQRGTFLSRRGLRYSILLPRRLLWYVF
jgi:hypothetical protein